MRALIKTEACTYVEKVQSMYSCTFNDVEGLMIVPEVGDLYFIEMPKYMAESCIKLLFTEEKIDLTMHTAKLVDEDTNELYDDYLECT